MIKKPICAAIAALSLTACYEHQDLSLKIAHVNDTHAQFDQKQVRIGLPNAQGQLVPTYTYMGGYPRITTKMNQLRDEAAANNQEFLSLHAGDAFTGSIYFSFYKGELTAKLMNQAEFDAMVIGNHEFDLGNEALASFADLVEFPLISANTKVNPRDPMFLKYLPVTIKEVNEEVVGIVGLTTEYTEIISSPSDETTFHNAIETAQKAVDLLKLSGVNKVVFLTHLGLEEDVQLAESVSGIDVIIGGHSPELFGDFSNIGLGQTHPAPMMVNSPAGEPVCIMHSGKDAQAVGVTDVQFNAEGIVQDCTAKNVLLGSNVFVQNPAEGFVDAATYAVITDYIANAENIEIVEPEAVSQEILNQAKQEVEAFSGTLVGVAPNPLYHVRLPGETHPQSEVVMPNGSDVAPHVAASMAWKMEQTSGEPYVSMMNAGGVRGDLVDGVAIATAYEVLPFSSTVVTMKVSGESLTNTLQTNVKNALTISGVAFPYVANIQYSIDTSDLSNPVVSDIEIKNAEGIYEPLVSSLTYNMATTSYLAGGGDLYSFDGAADITDTGHVDAEVFSSYLSSLPDEGIINKLDSLITIN